MNESLFSIWMSCKDSSNQDFHLANSTINPTAQTVYLLQGSLCILFAFVAIAINIIFLVSLHKDNALQTASMKLLMYLGFIDLLQGSISYPLYAFYLLELRASIHDCFLAKIVSTVGHNLAYMTILSIFNIVLFQYLSIIRPFVYRRDVPIIHLMIFSITLSVLNFTFSLLSAFQFTMFDFYTAFMGGTAFCVLLFMMVSFVHMFITLHRNKRRITGPNVTEEFRRQISHQKRSSKLAKTALILLIVFAISYLPAGIFSVLKSPEMTYESSYIQYTCLFLAQSNTVTDFFVYQLRQRRVQTTITYLFCGARKSREKNRIKEKRPIEKK